MPTEFRIDRKQRMIFSRFWGGLTFKEVHEHRDQILAHPDYEPGFYQLADFTGVEEVLLSTPEVRGLVSTEPAGTGARRAFVAPHDLAYGLLRLYQMSLAGKGDELAVFRSEREAREWLGLGVE